MSVVILVWKLLPTRSLILWGKRFLYHLSNTKTYVIMHINGNCQGNSKFNSRCIISDDGLLCTASHDVGKWNKQNNNKYFSLIFQLSLLGNESTFFQTDITQKMSCLIFDESWIQDYESRSFQIEKQLRKKHKKCHY